MCISCHKNLSDEMVLKMFTDALITTQYVKMNSTSVGHLLYAAAGCNGIEAKKTAMKLAQGYCGYKKNKKLYDEFIKVSALSMGYTQEEARNQILEQNKGELFDAIYKAEDLI